jgi:uncharacterized protein YuzE
LPANTALRLGNPPARPATWVDSREASAGIVLDYDAKGTLVGIDIDGASREVELSGLMSPGCRRD